MCSTVVGWLKPFGTGRAGLIARGICDLRKRGRAKPASAPSCGVRFRLIMHGATSSDDEVRLWLDDDLVDRAAPPGWTHVTTAHEAIDLLDTERVVELSLDHDLGDDKLNGR